MKSKILVVEDEPSIAENVVFSLETDGFVPVLRDTGESALKALEEEGRCLVHCEAGMSRSPTIIMAFLVAIRV